MAGAFKDVGGAMMHIWDAIGELSIYGFEKRALREKKGYRGRERNGGGNATNQRSVRFGVGVGFLWRHCARRVGVCMEFVLSDQTVANSFREERSVELAKFW